MTERVVLLNDRLVRPRGEYVLYWARANRRVDSNQALACAAELANEFSLPLLYYEELTQDHPYASDRFHTFVLEGVPDTTARLKTLGVGYCFHLRRRRIKRSEVLRRLAAKAAAVVTDDFPSLAAPPPNLEVSVRAVDASCIVPMRLHEKREYAAYTIRPKIRRMLPRYLEPVPLPRLKKRWQGSTLEWHTEVRRDRIADLVAGCEINHDIGPSLSYTGGAAAASRHLQFFLEHNLRRYARERNQPAAHATSGLSPYLHFGHISSLHVALAVKEYARQHSLIADEFLEELVVRRELAFNYACHVEKPDSLANLPDWARETLLKHAADVRPYVYSRDQFESAATHDTLWNATQKELLLRGKIHGYYRMYWGKKIIEWSPTSQDALETMTYLHDRYALDGRDPSTYANILWCFGLHDRPWGERPVFGTVRYMSLDGMKRKTDTAAYLREIDQLERTGMDPLRIE